MPYAQITKMTGNFSLPDDTMTFFSALTVLAESSLNRWISWAHTTEIKCNFFLIPDDTSFSALTVLVELSMNSWMSWAQTTQITCNFFFTWWYYDSLLSSDCIGRTLSEQLNVLGPDHTDNITFSLPHDTMTSFSALMVASLLNS